MSKLEKIILPSGPNAEDGDTWREAFRKMNLLIERLNIEAEKNE